MADVELPFTGFEAYAASNSWYPYYADLPDDILVVDLETTTKKEGIKAVDGNEIYLIGVSGKFPHSYARTSLVKEVTETTGKSVVVAPFKILVGHNIKFDLEYLRRNRGSIWVMKSKEDGPGPSTELFLDIMEFVKKRAVVLDTQFITYLHSGHRIKFGSLEECCEYWGISTKKTINLSEELEKVDYDIRKILGMREYTFNDLMMTSELITKILKDPWVVKNFSWLLKMHDGYLGTHEIEYNGMHIDIKRLATLSVEVQESFEHIQKTIKDHVALLSSQPRLAEFFEPSSNDHVATALYGGTLEVENRIPVGVYASGPKMGQPRHKIEKLHFSLKPLIGDEPERTETGKIKVSEDVLEKHSSLLLCEMMLKYRELAKLKGTYIDGLGKHVRVDLNGKAFVYPQINTCATATGRTSSSKPNMQNNPTHDSLGVSRIYTSRFGKEGLLVEVDFKQIEILALAVLSGDPQLVDDILAGRDIHVETGKKIFGDHMSKEERRITKTINFGLIYGGSPPTLAKQAKVPISIALEATKAFYARYPKVASYFSDFKDQVQSRLDLMGQFYGYDGGMMQKMVIIDTFTGRRYCFKDYMTKTSPYLFGSRGRALRQVSHTETRNYPIQGLATGDLMLCALGDVWRKVLPRFGKDVTLIGLVHDSLRFDVRKEVANEFMEALKVVLENVGNSLNACCKTDEWQLPIKVTFSQGENFFDMKEVNVDSNEYQKYT